MSTTNSQAPTGQSKCNNLRRRLDQLGYTNSFGVDSKELVERLFIDLLQTTESLKKLTEEKLTNGTESTETYKKENATLFKENNILHEKMMHIREDFNKNIKDLKNQIAHLQNQNSDITFLNNQYFQKLKETEQDSKEKSEYILKFQEKHFPAVVQVSSQKKNNVLLPRQKMEIDHLLNPNDFANSKKSINNRVNQAEDPCFIDLLKLTENIVARMREELSAEKLKNTQLQDSINDLRAQIESRNEEIDRLINMTPVVHSNSNLHENINNKQTISNLNVQIDSLQSKKDEIQGENRSMALKLDSLKALESENERLKSSLNQLDEQLHQLNKLHKKDVNKENQNTNTLMTEIEKLKNQLKTREIESQKILEDRATHSDQLEKITQLQVDKRKLTNRVSKLMATERELILEIDRLKHAHLRRPLNATAKSTKNVTDTYIANLEMERNFWKSEFNELQKMPQKKLNYEISSFIEFPKKKKVPTATLR